MANNSGGLRAMTFCRSGLLLALLVLATAVPLQAQQRIAFIDSDAILNRIPEYATIQQQIDRLASEWDSELEQKRLGVDDMFKDYQSRELLYTNEERRKKREEIMREEEEIERLRIRYFGPEGELFVEQDKLMRPLQERILEAVEEVATSEGYDYVFDRSGDFLFLYAREQNDIGEKVLEELGIDVESTQRGG
jgi:outer membrane protein